MTFQIGRFRFDRIGSVSRSGDSLRLTGQVDGTSTEGERRVRLQHFNGLFGNRDEPFVPFMTDGSRPELDGYYRVTGGSTDDVKGLSKRGGFLTFSIEMERVGRWYANPSQEIYAAGVLAAFDLAIDLTITDSAYLGIVMPETHLSELSSGLDISRQTFDGKNLRGYGGGGFSGGSLDGYRMSVPVDSYYDAACVIEQRVDGKWHLVNGTQTEQETKLRISNGITRLSLSSTGVLQYEAWDGDAWRSKNWTVEYADDGILANAEGLSSVRYARVIRNGPDMVTVRWATLGADGQVVSVTATCKRGEYTVEMVASKATNTTFIIARETAEQGDAISNLTPTSWAVTADAADANGHKYVCALRTGASIITAQPQIWHTSTTGAGVWTFPSESSLQFGLSLSVDAPSSGQNSPRGLAARYLVSTTTERNPTG